MLQGKTPLNNTSGPPSPLSCSPHLRYRYRGSWHAAIHWRFTAELSPKLQPAVMKGLPSDSGPHQKRPRLDRLYLRLQLVTRFFGFLVPEWTNLIGGYVGYSFRKLKT